MDVPAEAAAATPAIPAVHRDAICIDGHADLLMPITDGKTRLGERVDLPPPETWQPPPGWRGSPEATRFGFSAHTDYFQTIGLYDVPRLLEGGVTAEACAIFIDDANLDRALHRALEMVAWLHREAEANPDFDLVTRVEDIHAIKRAGKTGGFLALEGLEPLESDPKLLDVFAAFGLRMAGLAHNRRNPFADGTQRGVVAGGLTVLGKEAVQRMNRLGIVVDLAHLSQLGCWDVLVESELPVVLSHRDPRNFFPENPAASPLYPDVVTDRARELLDAIAANGGVVGVIGYGQPDLDAMIDHVGLGSDFFGLDAAPAGFRGIHELPNVTRRLLDRGYSDETVRKILGGNFLRVFEQVWR